MRNFLLALMLASAAAAQTNSDTAAAEAEKKKIRVEGRVTSLNGEVVRKATVRLQPAGGLQLIGPPPGGGQGNQPPSTYSETSDESGKFVFENVAAGRYVLTAEKTGFVTQRYGARSDSSPGTPLALEAGNQLKDIAIQMTPQAVIAGRVMDQDGDPVANVGVSVFRYGYSNGRRTLTPGGGPAGGGRGGPIGPGGPGGANTDDQGNFRIGNLSPGRYYVSADPRGNSGFINPIQEQPGRAGAAASKTTDVTTFYPNALDAKGASPVDVGAGGEIRGIDVRLRRERTYSIRGKAVDTTIGGPAAGAYVLALPPETTAVGPAALSNMARTSADGSFEIRNLLPGTHTIQASAGGTLTLSGGGGGGLMMIRLAGGPAGPESGATGRMEVTISDSDITGAVLQLTGGAEIAGTIRMEDGDLKDWLQPAQQNQQNGPGGLPPFPGPGTKSIRLATTEGISVSAPNAPFNADGTFQIKGVAPSKYFIIVGGIPQGTFVKSMRFGGQDVTRAPLDLTSGGGGTLDVVLSPKAADVTGAVLNEKGDPVQGVPVTLWPKIADHGSASSGIKTANTDQNGSFKISGLAPGDYYTAAWDDIPEAGLAQNPDFLAQFASDDTAVKVAESAHQNASVKLIGREKIVAEAAKIP
jgi:protocatechuate 3,4-dioxygenase beta subunit